MGIEEEGEDTNGKEWRLRQEHVSIHELCVDHFYMPGSMLDFVIKSLCGLDSYVEG